MASADCIVTVKVDTSHIQHWLDTYIPDLTKCGIDDCTAQASSHTWIEASLDTVGIGWQPRIRVYLCNTHFEELKHLSSPLMEDITSETPYQA